MIVLDDAARRANRRSMIVAGAAVPVFLAEAVRTHDRAMLIPAALAVIALAVSLAAELVTRRGQRRQRS